MTVIDFVISLNMVMNSISFPDFKIHKETWRSAGGQKTIFFLDVRSKRWKLGWKINARRKRLSEIHPKKHSKQLKYRNKT